MMHLPSEERIVAFVSNIKTPRTVEFRNCFEAGMDYETALNCVGFADQPALRVWWDYMERKNEE